MKKILFVLMLAAATMSFTPLNAPTNESSYKITLEEKEVMTTWRQIDEIRNMVAYQDMNNKFTVQAVMGKLDSIQYITIYKNLPDSIRNKKK